MLQLFVEASAGPKVSNISNRNLLHQPAGLGTPFLPKVVSDLISLQLLRPEIHLNVSTNLTQQVVTFLQHELKELDSCLLKYISPVYNQPLFKEKLIKKTGFIEVVKNTDHPLFDKWYDLVSRVFDKSEAYSTTRITFAWRGFCWPGSKVFSTRDKYAWFAFAYSCDLLLGPLPLYPADAHRQFQLDRLDTSRHICTLDNVRWLSKSDWQHC